MMNNKRTTRKKRIRRIKKRISLFFLFRSAQSLFFIPSIVLANNGSITDIIEESVEPIIGNITPNIGNASQGPEEIRDAIIYIAETIAVPLIIIAGIIVAIAGFYRLFFSESSDDIAKSGKVILR